MPMSDRSMQKAYDNREDPEYYRDDEICPVCNGQMEHHVFDEDAEKWVDVECRHCGGTGRI